MFSFLLQEVSDALDQGFMFSEGFMGIKGKRCMLRLVKGVLMIYACIYVSVIMFDLFVGVLGSFGPLCTYT